MPDRVTMLTMYLHLLLVAAALSPAAAAGHTQLEELVLPVVRGSLLEALAGALPGVQASCQCSQHAQRAADAASRGDIWALKVVDASARLPSGLLSGNVNQLGDFDECLGVGATPLAQDDVQSDCPLGDSISTSYCLASVSLQVPDPVMASDGRLALVTQLLYSYTPFKSNFSDPGHRVPRYSEAQLGVCVPSTCTAGEVQAALEQVLNGHVPAGLSFRASVPPGMCRAHDHAEPEDSVAARLARNAFWWSVAVVLTATFLDVVCLEGEGPAALLAVVHRLSARRNLHRLLDTKPGRGDVACLHGVRGINALGLLVAHKSVALLFKPYVNRSAAVQQLGMRWTVVGRVAILYTDCFILLSGVLTALSLLRQLDRTGRLALLRRILDRYVRLTPTLAALMVFCTLVLPGLGRGPMWGLVVEPHAALCRQHWWRNMLYIHNYFGFENMCLTHTHQLGIDMQLFAVAPLLVFPLWRWPRAGAALLAALAAASTALRYSVVLDNELSTIVYFGMPVAQMFKTASMSYILPTHRLTVYIMGVLLGYALHRIPQSFTFSTSAAALGWAVMVPAGLLPVFGPYHTATPGFSYDAKDAALYAAFAPILWSSFVCWGILACARGSGGWLGELISWRGWLVFTRTAYALYLMQFPIFFFNIGSARNADYYSIGHLLNMGEFTFIMMASVVLSLTFEMPFQELWKYLTEKDKDDAGKSGLEESREVRRSLRDATAAKRKSA